LYYYGVHKVRRNDTKNVTTNKMKSFYDAINKRRMVYGHREDCGSRLR